MIEFRLKEVLAKNNMTMADINKKTGISKNALSQLANGASKGIQFHTLEKILEVLKSPIQDLIVYTPDSQQDIQFSFDFDKHSGGVIVPIFNEGLGGTEEENSFKYIDNIRFLLNPLEVIIESGSVKACFNLSCDVELSITQEKKLSVIKITTEFPKAANDLLSIRFDSPKFKQSLLDYFIDLSQYEFDEYINDAYPSEFILNGESTYI